MNCMTVRELMDGQFLHFNSRELLAATKAWEAHIKAGGKMLVSLAGAMSTARIGRVLAPLIRKGYVHALSVTGANLEEDVFTLLTARDYKIFPNYRLLRAEDDMAIRDAGYNRVTDTGIPETVMRHMEERLIERWAAACDNGDSKFERDFLFDILRDPSLAPHFQIPREQSWMIAAMEMDIPVWSPGWEDSTTGNMFAAAVRRRAVSHHRCVKSGTEQMDELMSWYLEASGYNDMKAAGLDAPTHPSVGFFQVGGGIAGDFAICAVPTMRQDLRIVDLPFWGYFAQVTDAQTSYGGYSGAPPNEKITWWKLDKDTPAFMINSDATIVFPLVCAYLLGE